MGRKRGLIGFARSILRILTAKPQVAPSVAENETLQVVLRRRSVRSFARREISDEVFGAILEAGRLAPSTVNLQTWSFATFTRDSWREVFERPIPFRANRAVMVMGDQHRARSVLDAFPESPLVEYTVAVMNASLAAMNMTIAAEALGVASVMLSETGRTGLLDGGYLKEKLALPDGVYPLMTMVFGYPRGPRPPMPPKLPLEEICFEGAYEEADEGVMADWLAQMKAGYKASHPFSSFEAQLRVYESKIGRAEAALRGAILAGREQGADGTAAWSGEGGG
jgi:nitroreductase